MEKESAFITARKIIDLLNNGNNIEHLIQLGYDKLKNPFVFTDSTFKLLSYYPKQNILCLGWNEMQRDNTVSFESISKIKAESALSYYMAKEAVVYPSTCLWKGNHFSVEIMTRGVYLDKMYIGHISSFNYFKKFTNNDIETMNLIADAAEVILQKTHLNIVDASPLEMVLRNILNGDIPQPNIKNYMEKNGILLGNKFMACVFGFENGIQSIKPKNYIAREMTITMDEEACFIVHNDYIVGFFKCDYKHQSYAEQIKKLIPILEYERLYCGISYEFANIEQIREYYEQAVFAYYVRVTADTSSRLMFYRDCMLKHIASICKTSNLLTTMMNSEFSILQNYDNINGTCLLHTLRIFIENCRNMTYTANDLGIHYNTLKTRLEMIKSLTGICFDNRTSLKINFSFLFSDALNEK